MKIAYFDCSSGISGNMVLGALIDLGVSGQYLLKELKKLGIDNYSAKITKLKGELVSPTLVEVETKGKEDPRSLKEILKIITRSRLNKQVKELSKKIFQRLAEAESKAHGRAKRKIHFHELGMTDAIVDIVGSAIGIIKLKIDKVFCSALNVGKGTIKMSHGKFRVPAPATVELLRGAPIYSNNLSGELVTPTGAAIITSICDGFDNMPRIRLKAVGYGAGSRKGGSLNALRVVVGEAENLSESDAVLLIEADIDDMNPELYSFAIERILSAGALDAGVAPVTMKRGRPGARLTVLCPVEKKDKVVASVLSETTTLGVRTFLVGRKKLKRKSAAVKTRYGRIRIKVGLAGGGAITASPEYRDCVKAARKHRVPLKLVYSEAVSRHAAR